MSLDVAIGSLEARLPGQVVRDALVADLTTYRVGGPVAALVRVRDEPTLGVVAEIVGADGVPVLVIGRGSNLLVADRGFPGIAVVLEGAFEECEVDPTGAVVRAGAAVPLPVLARRASSSGVGGLEFFVGIPGSVGGAVRMNAGGHGRETADVLRTAWVLDLGAGETAATPHGVAALGLSYRRAALGAGAVVTRAEFAGVVDAPDACEARIAEIVTWRREHQPGGSNAGSVFRNPPNDSAGRLIESAGLKGYRVGGAVVSAKHANFFQAESGASATDVARLVEHVQAQVAAATGIMLEPELRMVGFDATSTAPADAVHARGVQRGPS